MQICQNRKLILFIFNQMIIQGPKAMHTHAFPWLVCYSSHHYFHLFQNTLSHDDVSMHIGQTAEQLLPAALHPSPTASTKAPSWNVPQVELGSAQLYFIFSLRPSFGRLLPLKSQLFCQTEHDAQALAFDPYFHQPKRPSQQKLEFTCISNCPQVKAASALRLLSWVSAITQFWNLITLSFFVFFFFQYS